MITKILLKDFKGITAEQELDKLNIFCGQNGTGKTARSQALSLAILGYVPEHGDKQPAKIYKTHGHDGKPFSVGVEIDGKETFGRTFHPDRQEIFHNKRKIKKADESKIIADLGVKVFDLSAFDAMSDSKKIEYLFDLFPPEGDLSSLDSKIIDKKNEVNKIGDRIRGNKSAIATMTTEQANMEVPAGTLAELTSEIEGKTKSLKDMQEGLEEEKRKMAKAKAEKEKKEAVDRAQKEIGERIAKQAEEDVEAKERKLISDASKGQAWGEADEEDEAKLPDGGVGRGETYKIDPQGEAKMVNKIPPTIRQIFSDFAAIKLTMENAGCDACAAMLVLKGLIGKYRKAAR